MGQVEQLGTNGNQLAHGPSTRRGVHQLVMPVCVCPTAACAAGSKCSLPARAEGRRIMVAVALAAVLTPLPAGSLAKPWTQWCTFPQLHRYRSGVLCLLAVGLGESMAVPGGYIQATVGSASPERTLRAGEP